MSSCDSLTQDDKMHNFNALFSERQEIIFLWMDCFLYGIEIPRNNEFFTGVLLHWRLLEKKQAKLAGLKEISEHPLPLYY